ncbi:MAG: site-2 protease family protein [Acidimicrobiales bacterium]
MLRSSITLGRIRGVPVGLHWSLLAIAGLLAWILATSRFPALAPGLAAGHYWSVAAVAVAVFFGSVLVHELAHALVARRHGVGTTRITLWLLGGVAELDREAPSPRAELRIAAAGPLASLGVAGLLAAVAVAVAGTGAFGMLPEALAWLALINVVLAVFNLIPAAPLDGGRILAAVLWRRHGDRLRAHEQATTAGAVVGWGIVGLGAGELVLGATSGLWTMLVGWFVVSSARGRAGVHRRPSCPRRAASPTSPAPAPAPGRSSQRSPWAAASTGGSATTTCSSSTASTAPWVRSPPPCCGLCRPQPETTTMEQLARPASALVPARGDEQVVDVLTRAGREGAAGIVLVDDQGRALGTVGRADLQRALQRGAPPDHPDHPDHSTPDHSDHPDRPDRRVTTADSVSVHDRRLRCPVRRHHRGRRRRRRHPRRRRQGQRHHPRHDRRPARRTRPGRGRRHRRHRRPRAARQVLRRVRPVGDAVEHGGRRDLLRAGGGWRCASTR